MNALLTSLSGYLKRQEWAARPDPDLVRAFAVEGSEEAFCALVARSGPLVKGRLERGRRWLAEHLKRRGFAPQALLAGALAHSPLPADLLPRARQCLGEAASVPISVKLLADTVAFSGWARLRLVLAGLLLA